MTIDKVHHCAKMICELLLADSGIPIWMTFGQVRMSLVNDIAAGSPFPTKEEACLLVAGDSEGEVPEGLIDRYPHLHATLEGFF